MTGNTIYWMDKICHVLSCMPRDFCCSLSTKEPLKQTVTSLWIVCTRVFYGAKLWAITFSMIPRSFSCLDTVFCMFHLVSTNQMRVFASAILLWTYYDKRPVTYSGIEKKPLNVFKKRMTGSKKLKWRRNRHFHWAATDRRWGALI